MSHIFSVPAAWTMDYSRWPTSNWLSHMSGVFNSVWPPTKAITKQLQFCTKTLMESVSLIISTGSSIQCTFRSSRLTGWGSGHLQ
eukprot:5803070-Amphidinium_carterae.1